MELLASGRDSDVYAYDERRVLRRYRDGRSAEREAATIGAVAALGFPVPTLHWAAGPDIVMERVEGPTLATAMFEGLSPELVGRTLADLQGRLHALDWPSGQAGHALLHLDLHPLNVLMAGSTPVVIDWTDARPGPPALDVAMTTLILAQVVTADDPAVFVGLSPPPALGHHGLRTALLRVLRTFTALVDVPYQEQLTAATELRRRDRHQSTAERDTLARAHDLAATLT